MLEIYRFKRKLRIGCRWGIFLLLALILFIAVSWNWHVFDGSQTVAARQSIQRPSAHTEPLGAAIAAEATLMQNNLYGIQTNQYNDNNPVFQKAIQYWQETCHNPDGSYCDEAKSGSLQCVEFVTGVFASVGSPLPQDGIGNGNQFWQLYHHRLGWTEIPVGGMPALGDIVAWSQQPDPHQPRATLYGHLAIIVDFRAPTLQHDGFVTVADANAPGTLYPGSDQPGNFYRMTWHSNSYIRSHIPRPDVLDTWPYFHVQGFIRHVD
jgi:hypothetical protein